MLALGSGNVLEDAILGRAVDDMAAVAATCRRRQPVGPEEEEHRAWLGRRVAEEEFGRGRAPDRRDSERCAQLRQARFHVDKMSSAHVYLRLNKGQTMDDISDGLLEDCAQLVKANSIQGNKVNNVDVVYTPWYNLKKTPSMDVGQVGFHNSKLVRTVQVEKRINEVINRLNKTKVERTPDLKAEREAVSAAEKAERKLQLRDKKTGCHESVDQTTFIWFQKRKEEMERLEKEKQAEIRSYKGLMVQDKMTSNKQVASGSKTLQELEDDFM
ncbi:coiled-coil domain-containing protein 25 [Hordeum vulgare]|nr:coiled-coil domain-containing protein 25 [Hordeum vulgare]